MQPSIYVTPIVRGGPGIPAGAGLCKFPTPAQLSAVLASMFQDPDLVAVIVQVNAVVAEPVQQRTVFAKIQGVWQRTITRAIQNGRQPALNLYGAQIR